MNGALNVLDLKIYRWLKHEKKLKPSTNVKIGFGCELDLIGT